MTVSQLRSRGMAVIMAMFFLVLGATLAALMFSKISTAIAVSKNNAQGARAMMNAESGLGYMQLKLKDLCDKTKVIGDKEPAILYNLGLAMAEDSGEGKLFPANSIVAPLEAKPVVTNAIAAPEGQFTSTLSLIPDLANVGHFLLKLSVTGTNGGASRTLGMDMTVTPSGPPDWMKYPMISKGVMGVPDKGFKGKAAVYKWDRTNKEASSDTGEIKTFVSGGQTAYALKFDDNVLPTNLKLPDKYLKDELYDKLVDMKDHGWLQEYTSGPLLKNVYISAKKDPTVLTNATLTGIIYVEWPQSIKFAENVTINGIIVYQKKPERWQETTSEPWPVIDIGKAITMSRNPDTANAIVMKALTDSGMTPEAAEKYFDMMYPWAIQAPDTDWNPAEGNTTGNFKFQGNIHIRNFLEAKGDGNAPASNYCTFGTIMCEGTVDLGGNRKFSADPQGDTAGDEGAPGALLTPQVGGYWEK